MELIWYVLVEDKQVGPFTKQAIRNLIKSGKIDDRTLVWKQGMDNWLPLSVCPGLQGLSRPVQDPSPGAATPAVDAGTSPVSQTAAFPKRTAVLCGILLIVIVLTLIHTLMPRFAHKEKNAYPPLGSGETWDSRFLEAVRYRDTDAAYGLLFYFWADVNAADKSGMTALHYAARNGDYRMIHLLLQFGADFEVKNRENAVPGQLLPDDADPRVKNIFNALARESGFGEVLPIHEVSRTGNIGQAKYLQADGALCLECGDNRMFTPLMIAVENKRYEMVLWLLDQGAVVNYSKCGNQANPMDIAVDKNDAMMVRILLEHGALPYSRCTRSYLIPAAWKCNVEMAETLLDHGSFVNARPSGTALFAAKLNHCKDVENFLIARGAEKDIEYAARFNDTMALDQLLNTHPAMGSSHHNAILYAAQEGNTDIGEKLLKHGADFRSDVCSRNVPCSSPLYAAVGEGHVDMVSLLLKNGVDPNHVVKKEAPVLFHAVGARENAAAIVEVLLKHGADPNLRAPRGVTPIFYAGSARVVNLLVKAGADVNATDANGNTPLHVVKSNGALEALLKHGANPNARNNEGRTPLDLSYAEKRKDIIKKYGGYPHVSNGR